LPRRRRSAFRDIRLSFEIDGDLSDEQKATLMKLTERYCVVYQTLRQPPPIGPRQPYGLLRQSGGPLKVRPAATRRRAGGCFGGRPC
jgi:hypothetical protein